MIHHPDPALTATVRFGRFGFVLYGVSPREVSPQLLEQLLTRRGIRMHVGEQAEVLATPRVGNADPVVNTPPPRVRGYFDVPDDYEMPPR